MIFQWQWCSGYSCGQVQGQGEGLYFVGGVGGAEVPRADEQLHVHTQTLLVDLDDGLKNLADWKEDGKGWGVE